MFDVGERFAYGFAKEAIESTFALYNSQYKDD